MAETENMGENTGETTNSATTDETKVQGFTQEDVDKIVSSRLSKEREANAKKYGDYDDLKAKCETYEKDISDMKAANEAKVSELQAKVKEYETNSVKMEIALKTGLPYDLAMRLQGDTEDEIKKDAETLMSYTKPPTAPPKTTETGSKDPQHEAMRKMVHNLTKPQN